jgi:histidyl-tRNA synthetase
LTKKIDPRMYKGTRDFLPEQMIKRQYVINIIKDTFEKYGFEPLETPTLELWETLGGKYGEEGDRMTYRFIDRGKREVGLRYDLTVPLSRVIAMYPNIPKPFKRYQIQPVWRADKPQKGRFREFYQCDIDVVGSSSVLADAEILAAIYEVLNRLGFNDFTIRLNSRKILAGIVEVTGVKKDQETAVARAIDKLDKIGRQGVRAELQNWGIDPRQSEIILQTLEISGNNQAKLRKTAQLLQKSEIGTRGIQELSDLLEYLSDYQIPEEGLVFDLFLARGLDYYTGPIYETVVEKPRIGSITGGGRYDKLIGLFSGSDQPATGCSIGLERIVVAMEELEMFPADMRTPVKILVTVFDKQTLPYSIRITQLLRSANINADLYSGDSQLRGQFGLANDKSIPLVIVAGPEEMNNDQVSIKDMTSGQQKIIKLDDLIFEVKKGLP